LGSTADGGDRVEISKSPRKLGGLALEILVPPISDAEDAARGRRQGRGGSRELRDALAGGRIRRACERSEDESRPQIPEGRHSRPTQRSHALRLGTSLRSHRFVGRAARRATRSRRPKRRTRRSEVPTSPYMPLQRRPVSKMQARGSSEQASARKCAAGAGRCGT